MTDTRRDYHVQDLQAMTKDLIWALPKGGLRLTFDDGETLVVPTYSTIRSWYMWRLFSMWPGAKITKRHHLLYSSESKSTHVKLMDKVFKDVVMGHFPNFLEGEANDQIWTIARIITEVTNELYNDTLSMLGSHVTGLDLEDLLELQTDPKVVQAKKDFDDGKITAEEEHNIIFGHITGEDTPYPHNNIVRDIQAGALNKLQSQQVIGSRAYHPDIDGESCEYPIIPGYGDGITSLYDRLYESRGAAISVYMTSGPLEDSEYNNRVCQQLCAVISGIEYGDCGGQFTVPWLVGETDLESLIGKVYQPAKGKYKMIKADDTHLVGQTINVRSITTCSNDDPSKPCSVCLGWNSVVTPPKANPGHMLAVKPLGDLSQTIMSFKHVIASTKNELLSIDGENNRFLAESRENPFYIHMTREMINGKFALRLKQADVKYINNIVDADDMDAVDTEMISALTYTQFVEYDKMGNIINSWEVPVSLGGRGSPITTYFLEYMRTTGWDVIGDSIEIDIKDWDYTLPIIKTRRVGEDLMALLVDVTNFLLSPNTRAHNRAIDFNAPGPAIRALMGIFKSKFNVNFSQVEVFVRALMCKGETSFALPKGGEPFRFDKQHRIIQSRGIGGAFAYEGIPELLKKPSTYTRFEDNIPGTGLDFFV